MAAQHIAQCFVHEVGNAVVARGGAARGGGDVGAGAVAYAQCALLECAVVAVNIGLDFLGVSHGEGYAGVGQAVGSERKRGGLAASAPAGAGLCGRCRGLAVYANPALVAHLPAAFGVKGCGV